MDARDPARAGRPPTAYGAVGERLRREIGELRYPAGVPLPTELELARQHGVSRQTVRRAFQDLVAEGLVYRVPGRGSFVNDLPRKYLRSSGSIDDLLALAIDTDLEVLEPPAAEVRIEAAGRLHLDTDEVVVMRFRRLHEGRPYCVTTAYFPVPLGRALLALPELATPGIRPNLTVLDAVRRLAGPIAGADQTVTATAASAPVAAALECARSTPVLRIDRLYVDTQGEYLELAVNHFNPARYSYRLQMRAESLPHGAQS